jgi:hypothetical protein
MGNNLTEHFKAIDAIVERKVYAINNYRQYYDQYDERISRNKKSKFKRKQHKYR